MTKRQVEKYLKAINLLDKFTVKRIGKGNNAKVFLVFVGRERFTFRSGEKTPEAKKKFLNHYVSLKFLASQNIDFVSQPVYFDKKENILITTYLPGEVITEKRLTDKMLNLFIKQLSQIYFLSFTDYKKFCKQSGVAVTLPQTPIESLKQFGIKRFNKLKRICPDPEIINWIKPRLKENYLYLSSVKWNKKNLIFTHGDLTGANILKYQNKLFFIDWERARFVYSADYGLAYKFAHFETFAQKRDLVIKKFTQINKLKFKDLERAVVFGQKGTKINDVIWAALEYSALWQGRARGWKKYQAMTKKRIREYENEFENN